MSREHGRVGTREDAEWVSNLEQRVSRREGVAGQLLPPEWGTRPHTGIPTPEHPRRKGSPGSIGQWEQVVQPTTGPPLALSQTKGECAVTPPAWEAHPDCGSQEGPQGSRPEEGRGGDTQQWTQQRGHLLSERSLTGA